MPMLKRPDGEIYYEEFGSGFPILLFAPGGPRSGVKVTAFLDRHMPA